MRKTLLHSLGTRLVVAVLTLVALAPSVAWAADTWQIPTSKPKNPYAGGKGTKDDPYQISTAQQLANLSYMLRSTEYKGVYFCLTNDIVLNENVITDDLARDANGAIHYSDNKEHFDKLRQWEQIGGNEGWFSPYEFMGIFDGRGHSVSGVYVRAAADYNDFKMMRIGFFGDCNNARISNLTIKDSYFTLVSDRDYIIDTEQQPIMMGGLVGYAEYTSITNCHLDNCVIAGDGTAYRAPRYYVGGIVGYAYGKTIVMDNCSFNGVVEAYYNNDREVPEGKSSQYDLALGGIAGYTIFDDNAYISNCHTNGKLILNEVERMKRDYVCVGGIVGRGTMGKNKTSHLSKCSNRMDINVLGGLDFFSDVDSVCVAGIVAFSADCSQCVNFGNISCYNPNSTFQGIQDVVCLRQYDISGICQGGKTTDCINYGDISVGRIYSNNKDKVVLNLNIGGITSRGSTITRCYNCNKTYHDTQGAKVASAYDPITPYGKSPVAHCFHYSEERTQDASEYTVATSMHGEAESGLASWFSPGQKSAIDVNRTAGLATYGIEPGTTRWGTDNKFKGYFSLISLGAEVAELQGKGTEADPYLVTDEASLRFVQDRVANYSSLFADKCYKLTTNIDMTDSSPMPMIGADNVPFTGHFDGDGHFIRGVNLKDGSLFCNVAKGSTAEAIGKVEKLALIDVKYPSSADCYGTIARWLGNSATGEAATIEDCYATGNIEAVMNGHQTLIGGICTHIAKGSTVKNCGFWGTISVSNYGLTGSLVGGIAASMADNATIQRSMAAWTFGNPLGNEPMTVGSIVADASGGGTAKSSWGFLEYDKDKNPNYTNVTSSANGASEGLSKEYMLRVINLNESDDDPHWVQGRYGPALKKAYHYDCRDHNGNSLALLPIDRAPIEIHQNGDGAGYETGCNDILTLTPTDEQLATDTKMWQLANLAIFLKDRNADIVTDLRITTGSSNGYPASDIGYTPSGEDVELQGAATFKVGVKEGDNWYSLCLPGSVGTKALPEGFKLYVGGKLLDNKLNIIEVDSVPAGVPFLMYYDKETDSAVPDTVVIHMTGLLKTQASRASDSSDLLGTLANITDKDNLRCAVEQGADGKLRLVRRADAKVPHFSAYVANDADVELDTYLLLDENDNDTEGLLQEYKGQKFKIKMLRTMRANGWNTVCLPFGLGITELAASMGTVSANIRVEELKDVIYDEAGKAVVLKFENATVMERGKPYLVRPDKDIDLINFGTRELTNVAKSAEFTVDALDLKVSMVGTLPKKVVRSNDNESAYFLQANTFFRATASSPVTSPGFRCWFRVTNASGTKAALLQTARVVHADGTTTDIRLVNMGAAPDGSRVYDMQGVEHSGMVRGVNIVGGKKIVRK